jgi:iron-sulfur cluster assembly accessory protein
MSDMSTAVTISERAARRIGQILKGERDGAMLRISVEGGGCSGFQYKFDVEHAKAEDDLVIERDHAVVVLVPREQSKCHGLLRLRHELLHLIAHARRHLERQFDQAAH